MPYIVGDRRQSLLLPECIDDYVGATDPVRVYDAFVEQLDFAQLGIEIDYHRVAPEFDPSAMLKLLVYGYSYGIRMLAQARAGDTSQSEFHLAGGRVEAGS